MNLQLVKTITAQQLRQDIPSFKAGDTVRVAVRIIEGGKERIQNFEGLVIRRKGGGISETFIIRKRSSGIGVERTFFIHSPTIKTITVVKEGLVRRSRIYYIRKLSGKAARIREKSK